MYYVALMNDSGQWEALDNVPTYSAAEELLDAYCDLYPNAYVDVISQAEYESSLMK